MAHNTANNKPQFSFHRQWIFWCSLSDLSNSFFLFFPQIFLVFFMQGIINYLFKRRIIFLVTKEDTGCFVTSKMKCLSMFSTYQLAGCAASWFSIVSFPNSILLYIKLPIFWFILQFRNKVPLYWNSVFPFHCLFSLAVLEVTLTKNPDPSDFRQARNDRASFQIRSSTASMECSADCYYCKKLCDNTSGHQNCYC